MKPLFLENELPVDGLSRIGLWKDGKPVLSSDDLRAMLAGRRTGLVTLENVQADGFLIKRLDVKLSLHRSDSGQVSLQAHPIHHEIQSHPLLTEKDMKMLTEGKVASIGKAVEGPDGKVQSLIFEYDAGTKEFISYIPNQVQAPDRVNGELLTKKQKEAFQFGEPVELSDGTTFQHRASEPNGILSDRIALVVSVLMDGGISYLLLRGLRNLLGDKKPQKDEYTAGFKMALAAMERQQAQKDLPNLDQQEYTQGRGRSR
ncbi:DUF4099 domain-containing protein [Pedobacter chinensis]|uniref:DUF4099 domain-containing protein n=1 Tax=Pedobacter chinensis TaxID=2282421 RepID=A0A369PUM8_9SPHI|nr:DUF4099 domain-containing protein [Pedobacter chinensis]RDC54346.1 DUF4099 domain-containing protein [Pedobacter chinensis]